MKQKNILLIITGSVAAYKAMDLVRLLKKKSYNVTCILTKGASEFITPLLASSLSGNKTYNELFSVSDELEMGHINLSRQADLIVVAPATADFIAKISGGLADDLASNVILAANKKIILAPAMNEKMWENKATQQNLTKVLESGISMVEDNLKRLHITILHICFCIIVNSVLFFLHLKQPHCYFISKCFAEIKFETTRNTLTSQNR